MDISSFIIDSLLFNRFSHKISTSEKEFFPIIRLNITQAMTTKAELLQNIDKGLLIESILE